MIINFFNCLRKSDKICVDVIHKIEMQLHFSLKIIKNGSSHYNSVLDSTRLTLKLYVCAYAYDHCVELGRIVVVVVIVFFCYLRNVYLFLPIIVQVPHLLRLRFNQSCRYSPPIIVLCAHTYIGSRWVYCWSCTSFFALSLFSPRTFGFYT